MLLLQWWLVGFHMLSYIWSNEIQSGALTAVEHQLSWCKANKNLPGLVCTVPFDPSNFFILSRKMWTDLNTWPLEDGYPGVVSMPKIPFLVIKVPNSSPVNPVPLSETTISGNPWVAKTHQSSSIVSVALILDVGYTSIHLLHALIMIRKKCPVNGPAWFMCKWDQDLSGNSQGWRGAVAGAALWSPQTSHHWTLALILSSNPGHHR